MSRRMRVNAHQPPNDAALNDDKRRNMILLREHFGLEKQKKKDKQKEKKKKKENKVPRFSVCFLFFVCLEVLIPVTTF